MTSPKEDNPDKGERIAKALARAGVASRREVERMIEAGRVKVDGTILDTPAFLVTEKNVVEVDGKTIGAPEAQRLWRYHKPVGLVTSHRDEKGRETVFDKMPPEMPRVVSVGRLDLNSEGLLLLTNDGALARALELPSRKWARKYRVRVHGRVNAKQLETLADGITIEGVRYGEIIATLDSQTGANAWLSVSLREGKNREIRKVLAHLGLDVNRLIRTSYGPFRLGKLARGAIEEIPRGQILTQLGDDPNAVEGNVNRAGWAKPAKKKMPPHKKRTKPKREPLVPEAKATNKRAHKTPRATLRLKKKD